MPVKSQPRFSKRVESLSDYTRRPVALYFDREYFVGTEPPCKTVSLGRIMHGAYIARIGSLFKAIIISSKYMQKRSIVYCFGLDMTLIAIFSSLGSQTSIVYEVADIRSLMLKKSIAGRFSRWLERIVVQYIDSVVVTSPLYIQHYFLDFQGIKSIEKFHVLENKLSKKQIAQLTFNQVLDSEIAESGTKRKIVIGYFGLLRCARSIEILRKLANTSYKGFEFHINIHGKTMGEVDNDDLIGNQNIEYFGEYKWPDDLAAMYQKVDIVWACYPYGDSVPGNWQWAKTNRFYEACVFSKPMIVLKNSGDAEAVRKYGIGVEVDMEDTITVVNDLKRMLNFETLHKLEKSMCSLPTEVYQYEKEHEQLIKKILKD